ncbi:MAG: hypothetical protein A2622_01570 [Bdellovibrionales bacterium RIFCSPHIGHO2_01_FULL_40_29]|nr:MAG: hypothetical protein A2622_01570 [Bdellovibrionales bacterium RIFCSPHIGHO2_01_FULL_40_29]OFZ33784.1 MAG: hypothetical protein A3D17_01990 [Bdellovibrionales bacterium RIFCSPHIGHO2_02_FULL_40_15]
MELSFINNSFEVLEAAPGRGLRDHSVQFYQNENLLIKKVAEYIEVGLKKGEGAVIIASAIHSKMLLDILRENIDVVRVIANQQLLILNAQEILSEFMVDETPDPVLFKKFFSSHIMRMTKLFPEVRAYGELVNILWEDGNLKGTIELEKLWSELSQRFRFSLLCGYSMENFRREIHGVAFTDVCNCHVHVYPAENGISEFENDEYRRLIAELQQKTMALQTEISERRSIEAALRKSHKELKIAKDFAEAASYTKSRFLANMSHEIRSPLTAVLGFTELMKDPTLSAVQRASYADIVSRNGRQLSTLINDILDLSKVEAGKLDIELVPMSLPLLIHDVTNLFQQEAAAKGLKLVISPTPSDFPSRICSDPTRIHQILTNLVGNAIKFTSAGEIRITFQLNKSSADSFVDLIVEDTGIGMTDEQQEKIFQPFMQADSSTTRKYGGTGLGLTLSKKLSKALGGDLQLLFTEQNRGSRFLVNLKSNIEVLEAMSAADVTTQNEFHPQANENEKGLENIRILIAEDSLDNQILIRRYLEKEGALVDIAENGLIAVEMALRGNYQLILMDVMMPVCDGYEATKRLRSTGYKKPIVALTAHALRQERERSFAEGCNEHLTKPINRQLLVSTISKFVFKS